MAKLLIWPQPFCSRTDSVRGQQMIDRARLPDFRTPGLPDQKSPIPILPLIMQRRNAHMPSKLYGEGALIVKS